MSDTLQANKIDVSRWRAQDIFAQLGNVASEVSRTFKSQEKGNDEQADSAFWRALELLDATIADPKNFKRGKELRRARELFCSVFFKTPEFNETPASVKKYFMSFAIHNQYRKYA
jgi:hypothetical protein